jgi:hypothetical protein
MTRTDWIDVAKAARDVTIFFAFTAVLVTAPALGEWLDSIGAPDVWERAVADRHAEIYERMTKR